MLVPWTVPPASIFPVTEKFPLTEQLPLMLKFPAKLTFSLEIVALESLSVIVVAPILRLSVGVVMSTEVPPLMAT